MVLSKANDLRSADNSSRRGEGNRTTAWNQRITSVTNLSH